MAIQSLSDEQVRTMTREQKDRWWLQNVFRGDMPQLTIRSAITGFVLGGLLSATNLYVGAKTGWTLGVGLTSVILAFAMFRVLSQIGARDLTILENNCTQSIATSAGYMTGPLVSGIAAYMMVKNQIMPWWQMMLFNVVLSILGVLVAFPMKRRFINDEQQPFPEGRACGVLLDTLYTSQASVGLFKAKALAYSAIIIGFIKFLTGESYHRLIQGKILGLDTIRWLSEHPMEKLFAWFQMNLPTVHGISVKKLELNPTLNLEMFGAGGLLNIRYAVNMIVGMLAMWLVTMPMIVNRGDTSNSSGKQLTPEATVTSDGTLHFWGKSYAAPQQVPIATNGRDARGMPLYATVTITAAGATDATGAVLKMPLKLKAGQLADSTKDKFEQTKIVEGEPVVINGNTLALPVALRVFDGEDADKKAITPQVVIKPTGPAYADGEAIAAPLTVDRATFIASDGSEVVVRSNFIRSTLLNSWALWPGVAMLVCASMAALFAKPQVLISAFSGLFGKKKAETEDCLKHIELPLRVSFIGIPIVGAIGVWMAHEWFDVRWIWGALAIPLIAVLSLIAANATALTSITPTGSLSKITQFTFGALDRKYPVGGAANPAVNLMTACMTTEVASNAANLLMDIKPGYMLGAKPRQQVIGHIIGIVSGAIASTPLFYIMFLAGHSENPFTKPSEEVAGKSVSDVLLADPEKFSFTGAVQWKGISDLITGGLSQLPYSAIVAMIIAAAFGVIFEVWRTVSKCKFPISPLAIGLGIVLPPDSTLWMFLGSLFFYIMHKVYEHRKDSVGNKLWIQTHEPICAGIIAGAALIGIGDKLIEVFLL